MPMKGSGVADDSETIRWEGGLTWIAHPDETMQRASHALVVDGPHEDEDDEPDVWLVDPVDTVDLDETIADPGRIAGVVILLDRHKRDSAAVARRHDVPVYVHATMDDVAAEIDADVERFDAELADTGYRSIRVLDRGFWTEVALFSPADGTLVVPEALGAVDYFLAGDERLGVHPMLRLLPPRGSLGGLSPERIVVGHGAPVVDDPKRALDDALAGARRRSPRLYVGTLRDFLPV
ncbi:hypothetical protein SAMN06269185_0968 [Natronoarchaeum philippinense]|uniref:Glyoxylase, beta-lactamase superfamily II n=1 Tax=Natronoarchaeum philippinense TaxID=558529 RepID=A0A285NAD4_NATPI|nr:hypothetical protein [Natronoarchaeum philippinense]SNZ05863.1 hypothetical protein SAMN06269185_0968 [Natronoarchaeum philippinense]